MQIFSTIFFGLYTLGALPFIWWATESEDADEWVFVWIARGLTFVTVILSGILTFMYGTGRWDV